MGASLLTLVQRASRELGLPVPPTVAGSTDTQTQQLFGLANAVGEDLLSEAEWTALMTQAIINVEVPWQGTGDTTANDATVTNLVDGVTPLAVVSPVTNYILIGNGIQVASRVLTNPAPGTVTVDMNATATATGQAFTLARDTYAVPADFVTFMNRTQWDRTNHWELIGPMSPQENQWVMSGIVTTGPRRRFRQVGRGVDVFRIWPPPTANDTPSTLSYEYVSSYWASDSAGTPQAAFVYDTDTCVYDDRLMIAGIKYMYFASKGFEASRLERDYRNYLQTSIGRDGGGATLNMSRSRWPIFISPASVQDGNFPGSTP